MATLHEKLEQWAVPGEAYIECAKCHGRIIADDEYEAACDAESAGWTVTARGRVLCPVCRPAKRATPAKDSEEK